MVDRGSDNSVESFVFLLPIVRTVEHRYYVEFKDGESVEDFGMRIVNLVATLKTLRETIDEPRVVKKFLRMLPPIFNQVAVLLGILNANRKIRKRMDTDVAFTREYSKVSIFHRERECTN